MTAQKRMCGRLLLPSTASSLFELAMQLRFRIFCTTFSKFSMSSTVVVPLAKSGILMMLRYYHIWEMFSMQTDAAFFNFGLLIAFYALVDTILFLL
jgi:hypothetical protein